MLQILLSQQMISMTDFKIEISAGSHKHNLFGPIDGVPSSPINL